MKLSDIRSRIRKLSMVEEDFTDDEIDSIVNEGLYNVAAAEDWSWVQASTTILSVAGQQAYSLPSDFVRHIILTSDEGIIKPTTFEDSLNIYGVTPNESTIAKEFYMYGDSINILPVPSLTGSAYVLKYVKTPTVLTTNDSPPWDLAYHDILVDYALGQIWAQQEYMSESNRSYSMYYSKLSEMKKLHNSRINKGHWVLNSGGL